MSRGLNRAERLRSIEKKYLYGAYTDEEMAEQVGVESRATIYKDRQLLIAEGVPFVEVERGRWKIDRQTYLSVLRISLYEATMLYLMGRRTARQTHTPNPHVLSVLRSVALTLHQALVDKLLNATQFIPEMKEQMEETAVLEKIITCWVEQRKIRIRYRGLNAHKATTHLVSPYLLEPSLWDDSIYMVGYSETMNRIVPFKLNRIEKAADTTQPIVPSESFDENEFIRNVWSIWDGDGELVTVKLKFRGKTAVRRVQESIWHPNQVEPLLLPNGDLIWSTQVAEWREMLPWIRGWGADCEVLEPTELRRVLIRETLALATVYGLNSTTKGTQIMDVFEQFITLPGKTDPQLTVFEHSSDVYHIALYLLEENRDVVRNPDLVKAGALLHDVGKIEQDLRQKQWVHQPHSAKYLQPLIDHPRLQQLLTDNNINMSDVNYDDLLLICEHHHDIPTRPDLLRRNPDALLVSVADVLASAIEGGWLGNIREMLQASPYIKLNTSLLKNLELDNGLDGEIHRIDLPAESVPDALLCDLIYRDMSQQLKLQGMTPLLQKNGSLWVNADENALQTFLEQYTVNPRSLYQTAKIEETVFENLLTAPSMPSPGSLEPSSMKFLLLNEQIAHKMASGLVGRKRVRQAFEYFDISFADVREILGNRDFVVDKLKAVGSSLDYLIAGDKAAYHYHHWRTALPNEYELLIHPADFDTWYAFLRDDNTFVGIHTPTIQERKPVLESVILIPKLTTTLWENRAMIDNLAMISPEDIVFRLLATQTEGNIGEMLAILVARREQWNWVTFVEKILQKRMSRQFGCLFELLNYEAEHLIVNPLAIDSLFVKVQDTIGEALYPFPLHSSDYSKNMPPDYLEIGHRWGLNLHLPRHLVIKVLNDLGV